jgi:cytoskeletal protein CcmA (bactofilin family)
MWKKDDDPNPTPSAPRTERTTTGAGPVRSTQGTGERATIGRSITIRGEVSGDEDLLIQGHVDGSVNLEQQAVTVGRDGRVKADITARVVTVEGEVEGDLKAEEQVILRSSAQVQGDITAPRVVLEDGASFRGGIDMGEPPAKGKRASDGAGIAGQKKQDVGNIPAQPDLSKLGSGEKKDIPDTVSKTGN